MALAIALFVIAYGAGMWALGYSIADLNHRSNKIIESLDKLKKDLAKNEDN